MICLYKFICRFALNDDYGLINNKINENNKIINEYENWINMLLNIMNNSDNSGFVDIIKTGIEKIRVICEDDIDSRSLLMKEYIK